MIPKFRIFDKNFRLMLDVHVIDFYERTIDCYADDLGVNRQEVYSYEMDENNYALMQSTGLHDKKTKEIYYDDILKCDDGTLLVVDDVRTHSFLDLNMHLGYEVIGNIHEHSHLLDDGGQ